MRLICIHPSMQKLTHPPRSRPIMSMAISILHSSHRYAFVLIGKQLGGPDSVLAESAEQMIEILNVAAGADAVIGAQISVITELHIISVHEEIFIQFEPCLLLFPTYAKRGRETACLVALKIRRSIDLAGCIKLCGFLLQFVIGHKRIPIPSSSSSDSSPPVILTYSPIMQRASS